jgi:hypothetical protein
MLADECSWGVFSSRNGDFSNWLGNKLIERDMERAGLDEMRFHAK